MGGASTFWQKTKAQQLAVQKAADEKDESKPRHLCLALSDFVLSHSFDGWEFDDLEPRHRVVVSAKWRHWDGYPRSERIFLNGLEINPETTPIWFRGVGNSKTETDKSHASHGALDVRLTDAVLKLLVKTVEQGQITEALLCLETEPWADRGPRLLLGYSSLRITSQPRAASPLAEPVTVSALNQGVKWYAIVIIALLVAILVSLHH